jgi:hypothetical protein
LPSWPGHTDEAVNANKDSNADRVRALDTNILQCG